MKRVIFIISELNSGGTQKTVKHLIDKFYNDNFIVKIITFEKKKNYNLKKKKIEYFNLNASFESKNKLLGIINNIYRIILIRRILKKNNNSYLISFLTSTNILSIFANFFLNNKLILSERNDPLRQPINFFWRTLRFFFYRFADEIICNSKQAIVYFNKFISLKKLKYIPNYINLNKSYKSSQSKIILSIGRMHMQKGFDTLIKGFKKSKAVKLKWKLILIGNGPEKRKLQNLSKLLNLGNNIKFINYTNPYKWYKKAGIFALFSRYEGMPNVVLEAASFKLPIIISKDTGGALDIVKNNKSGVVVKNNSTNEVGKCINKFINNSKLRKRMGYEVYKKIKNFSNIDTIYMYWKKIIIR